MNYLRSVSKDYQLLFILSILLLGLIYKIFLTWDGNFLFNMDNARDFVDVRSIVELKELRLIGHTTGIEGLYNGPFWYYFLAIGYILSNGNPYSGVLMMISCWFIGGLFLYLLTKKYGFVVSLTLQSIWLSSNYIMLSTIYAFNPNPILLLMPVFVYFLKQFVDTNSLKSSIFLWVLSGLFINFELAYGMFMPVIILLILILSKDLKKIFTKNFMIGFFIFIGFCLPQLFFELRHNFFMTHSILNYISSDTGGAKLSLLERFKLDFDVFYNTITPTFMNNRIITNIFFFGLLLTIFKIIRQLKDKLDLTMLISFLIIIVSYIGFSLAPMTLYTWHITGSLGAAIILLSSQIFYFQQINKYTKYLAWIFCFYIIIFSIVNLELPKNLFEENISMDASNYKNELNAVDYVYQDAKGKDFKVYSYLPSVIDYPYQYIIWWRGVNKYGYTPIDYAYLPNKPQYIENKEAFIKKGSLGESESIYLIKEPDRIGQRDLWENNFKDTALIKTKTLGPLVIEMRKKTPI